MRPTHARTKPAPIRLVKQHRVAPPPQDWSDAPIGSYTWRLTTTTTVLKSALHPTPVESVSWERVPLRSSLGTTIRRPGPRPMPIPTASASAMVTGNGNGNGNGNGKIARRPRPHPLASLHSITGTATSATATASVPAPAPVTSTPAGPQSATHVPLATNGAQKVLAEDEKAAAQAKPKSTVAAGKGRANAARKRKAVAEAGEGGRRKSLRLMFAKEGGGL